MQSLNTQESIFGLTSILRELGERVSVLGGLQGLDLRATSGNDLLRERRFLSEATATAGTSAVMGGSPGVSHRSKKDALMSESASKHVGAKLFGCAVEGERLREAIPSPRDDAALVAARYPLREAVKAAVYAITAVGLRPAPAKRVAAAIAEESEGKDDEAAGEHVSKKVVDHRDVYAILEEACGFSASRIAQGTPDRSTTVMDERTARVQQRVRAASEESEKLRQKLEKSRAQKGAGLADINALIAKATDQIAALEREMADGVRAVDRVTDEQVTTLVQAHQSKDASLKAQLAKAQADLAKMEEANELAFLQLSKRRLNAKSELAKVIAEYDEGMTLLTTSIEETKKAIAADKGPFETLSRYFSLVDLDRRLAAEEAAVEAERRAKEELERYTREKAAAVVIGRSWRRVMNDRAAEKKGKGKGAAGGKKGAKGSKGAKGTAAAAGGSPEKKAAKKK